MTSSSSVDESFWKCLEWQNVSGSFKNSEQIILLFLNWEPFKEIVHVYPSVQSAAKSWLFERKLSITITES